MAQGRGASRAVTPRLKYELKGARLDGVQLYSLIQYSDKRGWFSQQWTDTDLINMGFRAGFIQSNIAMSNQFVLRGMHRQDQTKLVQVISGRIFDVVLNPETGAWAGYKLVENDVLLIPSHYAHGYMVLSDTAIVQYFVDKSYQKDAEETFKWDGFGIEWPLKINPVLSDKDS